MAHVGFKKLEKEIAKKGNAKDAAKITAAIGRNKYGAKKMAEAAAKGKPLKENQRKK